MKSYGLKAKAVLLSRCFNECDFVDLFERGQAAADASRADSRRKLMPSFWASCEFRRWFLFQNDFADGIGQIEQLVDGGRPR